MTTTTTHAPGTFCWPELATSDQDGARKFYTALFGWNVSETPTGPGETYTVLQKGDRAVGALYRLRADQSAKQAKQLGATLLTEPFDVMDLGRMAVITDPTGATFAIWESKRMPGAGVLDEPGSLCWTELMTRDTGAATRFYSGLFGWQTQDMSMGPMTYTVFKRGDKQAAGLMAIPPDAGQAPPSWTPYFAVEDTNAIATRTKQLGGKVTVGPQDVPNVGRFASLIDPQGAHFAILGPTPKS